MLAAMPDLADVDVSSVERFLATWYGPPDRPAAVLPSGAAWRSLPEPLRAWYALASRYSVPLTFHNAVVEPDQVYQEADKVVFWVENQGGYLWAADAEGDDPMVHERADVDGAPWQPTGVPLSGFLLNVVILEACIGGARYRATSVDITEAQTTACLAPLRPMPYPGPTYRGQLYVDHQTLAFVTPSSDDRWWVTLGAHTSAAIAQLIARTTGIGWDIEPADDRGGSLA
jgi:hypothetical protein